MSQCELRQVFNSVVRQILEREGRRVGGEGQFDTETGRARRRPV